MAIPSFKPHSCSASNITSLEVVPGLEDSATAREDQESSNSSIIKVNFNKESRRILKTKRACYRNGMKGLQARQNQENEEGDDEADTANSYAKRSQYKWLFEKELSRFADLSCRLLLGKQLVSKKIIPHLDGDSAKACQTRTGLVVDVWDVDTETQHQLVLSKWYTDYYSIDCHWRKDFVDRRNLKIDDKIKLGVDELNSRFCFSVVRKPQD